jgi:hypothetical protein
MAFAATSSSITGRMIRAAKLEVPLYEEVEADITATNQALLVVVIVAIATGIGRAIVSGSILGMVFGIVNALIVWAVWAYIVYFVGTRFMGGTATYGELLRTLAFAETPLLLLILGFLPLVGGILSLVGLVWWLVASFIATRQALDIDNGKTAITIVLGAIAGIVVFFCIGLVFRLVGFAF